VARQVGGLPAMEGGGGVALFWVKEAKRELPLTFVAFYRRRG
jgi:hypothetical protein